MVLGGGATRHVQASPSLAAVCTHNATNKHFFDGDKQRTPESCRCLPIPPPNTHTRRRILPCSAAVPVDFMTDRHARTGDDD